MTGRSMTAVNLIVVVESTRTIISHEGDDKNALHVPSLIAVAAALGAFSPHFTLSRHNGRLYGD